MQQVAFITGANRGLGAAVARRLAAAGVKTIVGARDAERGELTAAALRNDGLDAECVVIDVTSAASVQAAAALVASRHGRLDILVNNAGILPEATAGERAEPLSIELFRQTFETNVFGVVAVTAAFLPLLRAAEAGRIVNVSSTMGSLTDQSDPASPFYGVVVPAYNSSKAALNAVTVALAKLLVDTAVSVDSVCPGWVQTDLGGPANRASAPTTADEAARVVAETALAGGGGTGRFLDRNGFVAW
jgi:NAD(P)-dependent dehydrogenase (short-subunit alcohol dehydrogenase family)